MRHTAGVNLWSAVIMKGSIALALFFLLPANSPAQSLPESPTQQAAAGSSPAAEGPAQLQSTEAANQGPWEVGEIAVQGNVNIKPAVIRRTVKARRGELYYKEDVNKDIQAILGLGSVERASVDINELPGKTVSSKFSGIAASTSTAVITYIISERPQIKKIAVEGSKQLSKSTVLDAMSLKQKDHLDEIKLKEDVLKIAAKYHEKGFIDATADYKIETDTKTNTCSIQVAVREGQKAKIAEVLLSGASSFPVKKLVKKMKNRPKKIYSPADLSNDQLQLETFYKNNGYQDFKIEGSTVVFNEDKSRVYITIHLTEGPRYYFGWTSFEGNTVYTDAELLEALEYRKGKIFSQSKFDDTIRAVQEKYADKGYLKATVKPEKTYNQDSHELDVRFRVMENTIVYVDHVDVEGNQATKTYVLKREVVLKEGDVFSAAKIRKSQERIMNLGFIDDAQVAINPTADPDKVDVGFDVIEGKPGMLTAGAGMSSIDGLIGTLSLQHLNLFGRAQRTSVAWQFGSRVNDYSLSWTTPWFRGKPTSLGLDLFNTRRLRPFSSASMAFNERRVGGRVRVGPRFQNDKYQLNFYYAYEKVTIFNVEQQFLSTLSQGTSVTSSVMAEFVRDTRDNIWDPTRGCRTSVGVQISGGPLQGDVNFYKPSFNHSYNWKLFTIGDYPFVLSFANRFGFVGRYGNTETIPVFERYFLGGPDTVRGYNITAQVGPAFGGRVFDVFNTEFKFPLARERKRTVVQGAFFLDIGNAWDSFGDMNTTFGSDTRRLKAGAGFGIRFTTPAFPIRLDWGYGFNHKPGERRSEIYFTLGNLF